MSAIAKLCNNHITEVIVGCNLETTVKILSLENFWVNSRVQCVCACVCMRVRACVLVCVRVCLCILQTTLSTQPFPSNTHQLFWQTKNYYNG